MSQHFIGSGGDDSSSHYSFFMPYVILTIALAVQSFHMLEHIAQLVQKFVLNIHAAHGLLGASLDFEPVHFTYNTIYLALVVIVWLSFRNTPIKNMKGICSYLLPLISFVLVTQSWHFVEHAVKLEQHFISGCLSCPGILGYYTDPILLHFAYNTIVFLPLVVVYVVFQYKFIINRDEKTSSM
jgi:hypothetical protein